MEVRRGIRTEAWQRTIYLAGHSTLQRRLDGASLASIRDIDSAGVARRGLSADADEFERDRGRRDWC